MRGPRPSPICVCVLAASLSATAAVAAPTTALSGPSVLTEGQPETWTATASSSAVGPIGLSWVLYDATGASVATATGGSFTAAAPDDGFHAVVVTAVDAAGGVATDARALTVLNAAPTATLTGPATVAEGAISTWSVVGADPSPIDAALLATSWRVLDGGGATLSTGVGATWTGALPDDGTWIVIATVTDPQGADGSAIASVIATNVAPTITSIPSTALVEGAPWTYTPTIEDPGADTPIVAVSWAAPASLTVDPGSGTLAWTPTWSDLGSRTFTLLVHDGDGGATAQSITLHVAFADDDGDGMPDTWEADVGLDATVDDGALDPDGDGVPNLAEWLDGTDPFVFGGPDSAALASPTDGEEVDDARPALIWLNAADPDGDVLTYAVELWADAALGALLAEVSGVPEGTGGQSQWTPPVVVAENSAAWWRVRAHDGAVHGPWTDLAEFFVNAVEEAPAAPSLLEPIDDARVDTSTPLLRWLAGVDPDGDEVATEVRLWNPAQDLVIAALDGIESEEWLVPVALIEGSAYSWQARGTDAHGTTGPWSAPAWFVIDASNAAPSAVTWLAPVDGEAIEDLEGSAITRASDAEGDAIEYAIEADTVADFASPDLVRRWMADQGGPDIDVDLAGAGVQLDEDTLWHLRARAEDARGGLGPWTAISVFVRGPNDPPSPPTLRSPQRGGALPWTRTPTFVVGHSVDPEGDPVQYAVALARADAPDVVVGGVDLLIPGVGPEGTAEQTSWRPARRLEPGDWVWWAEAVDDRGASRRSAVWAFTVVGPELPPAEPDGVSGGGGLACAQSASGSASPVGLILLAIALRRRRYA